MAVTLSARAQFRCAWIGTRASTGRIGSLATAPTPALARRFAPTAADRCRASRGDPGRARSRPFGERLLAEWGRSLRDIMQAKIGACPHRDDTQLQTQCWGCALKKIPCVPRTWRFAYACIPGCLTRRACIGHCIACNRGQDDHWCMVHAGSLPWLAASCCRAVATMCCFKAASCAL